LRKHGRRSVLKGVTVALGVTATTVATVTGVTAAAGWVVAGTTSTRSKLQLAMPVGPVLASADDMTTGSIRRVASAPLPDYRNLVPHLKADTGITMPSTTTSVEKNHHARVQVASLDEGSGAATLSERFGDMLFAAPVATAIPMPLKQFKQRDVSVPLSSRHSKERDEPVPLPVARPRLAYASPDLDVLSVAPATKAPQPPSPTVVVTPDPVGVRTAVYDIEAHTVYLPSGKKLEAHSGLGDWMDDPSSMRRRMRGVTPPNTYQLTLREAMFHGVQAIRLNPVDEDKMFGRDGILAHTYMLGPNGQSNGCVSFRDYAAFLRAFRNGEVSRMLVVERGGNTRAAQLHGRAADKYAFDASSPEPIFSRRRPVRDDETQRADAGPPQRMNIW
jgi:hypothetical protein